MLYYTCGDGHVFQQSAASRLLSLHVGSSKIARCPVDGKWGRIKRVNANDLTDEQLKSARGGR